MAKTVAELRNRHLDETCWILGNGQSLLETSPALINDRLTIASNRIYLPPIGPGFTPRYYTVTDELIAKNHKQEIESFDTANKVFASHIRGILDCRHAHWIQHRPVPPVKDDDHPFSMDLEFGAYQGGTVLYFNLQLAIWMGVKKIILIGCDHDTSRAWHFAQDYLDKSKEYHLGSATAEHHEHVFFILRCAERHLRSLGVKVLNATPRTKLDMFSSVNFYDMLK